MMSKSMENKKASLLRSAVKRALAIKMEEEKRKQQEIDLVPYIPKDCVSNILVRLPLEALQRSRFVCKPWYNLINSTKFIDDHLRRSETVLLFLSSIQKKLSDSRMVSILPENPKAVSVEAKLYHANSAIVFDKLLVDRASKFSIQFLELKNGKCQIGEYNISCLGNIRATCNGLILLDDKMKKGGLVIMNPVTRKLMPLPLGTLSSRHDESYGFALSKISGEYKVVHLFQDYLGYISCEILNIGTRSWREVDGPAFGLLRWFGYDPVFAIGALHWTPEIDHSDHIVSMEVDSERFRQITLPKSSSTYDRIIEMSGFLGFVSHDDEFNQIDVWILKSLLGDVWSKHRRIITGCILDMIPLFSLRITGELVFKRDEDGSIYVYDFQFHRMTKVEMMKKCVPFAVSYFPHVNSLVSW
ncbi:putative F-box protein At3g10240 [Morus notabilis]|nr:putative F-box protein At3g10240 [Morus notabilis]